MEKLFTKSLLLTVLAMLCSLPGYGQAALTFGENLNAGKEPGTIYIESKPKGASVYIDEVPSGKTPILIRRVPVEDYSIRVSADGYFPYFTTVQVREGQNVNVFAKMVPEGITFSKKTEVYTTLMYEQSRIHGGSWAVGNTWGGYFHNINLEQTTAVHIALFNTIGFEAMTGYGFLFGDRVRLTPQIGYAYVNTNDIANDKYWWSGYLRGALNLKLALTDKYGFSATALYDRTGAGFRAGFMFYVN